MNRVKLFSILSFLLLGLTACFGPPPPVQLDFATSPAIFRGTYQTELDMRVSSPDVDLSPDSSILAMANGDYFHAVQFWDVESATPLGAVEAGFAVASVTMTPDGTRVAAVLPSYESHLPGSGRVWNVASGEVIHKLPAHSPACSACLARSLTISPDGATVAMLGVGQANDQVVSEVNLYDMASGERLAILSGPPVSWDTNFNEVSFSPDGSRLAAISSDTYASAQFRVWDVESGTLLGTSVSPTPERSQANAHLWQDNEPVVGIHDGERLELMKVISGQVVATLPIPFEDLNLYFLYPSPDSTRLIGGSWGGLALWDLDARAVLEVLEGEGMQAAGFSPDGRYALVYDNTTRALTLRDPDTLEVEKSLVNGEVVPLTLESQATYVNGRSYRVEGTAQLGNETPVPFRGTVQGMGTQTYLAPQTSSLDPIPAELELSFSQGDRAWQLWAYESIHGTATWEMATLSEKASFSQTPRQLGVQLRKTP